MDLAKKKSLLVLVVLLLIPVIWLSVELYSFLFTPLISKDTPKVNFIFAKGDSAKKVVLLLKGEKLIKDSKFFILFSRLSGLEHDLKAGEYAIDSSTTAYKLLQKMAKGDVIYRNITIVEGWGFEQLLFAVNNDLNIKHTIVGLDDSQIMKKIGAEGEIPEGRFAPDTYMFDKNLKDVDLLTTAYNLMHKRLQTFWSKRDIALPYRCVYEALIVASLIEKETADVKEKPIVADVILKRLKKGMPLQIDATIIYGLGSNFTGKLKRSDFLLDTPYNTYMHRGLPPTPICMPGVDSIRAALNPDKTDYWYYVSKGDGTHLFSSNFKDHDRARRKYMFNKQVMSKKRASHFEKSKKK